MTERSIQLFTPVFDVEACLAEIRVCLERGWTGIGFKTVEFEQQFGAYIGQPFCHFLNSNTNGMHLLLEMLRQTQSWQPGDEVISTAMTFVSTNHSIVHADLKPVFADVDASLCCTTEQIAQRITDRTRAVVFVAMGGNCGELEQIAQLCKRRGLTLILDAAHAAGSRLHGRDLSAYADYTVYSFQAVKNLPTADAGLVTVRTKEEDTLVRQLSWCGINKDTYSRSQDGYKWLYSVDHVGYKYNGNSIMAAIAIAELRHLDAGNARRRDIAARYAAAMQDVSEVRFIAHRNDGESSRHLVQFLVQDRNALIAHLESCGVATGVHYRSNTRYPMYAGNRTPMADELDQRILSMPCHLKLSDEDIDYIAESMRSFYRVRASVMRTATGQFETAAAALQG